MTTTTSARPLSALRAGDKVTILRGDEPLGVATVRERRQIPAIPGWGSSSERPASIALHVSGRWYNTATGRASDGTRLQAV